MYHQLLLKVNSVVLPTSFNLIECLINISSDCETGWRPVELGNREFCSKSAGSHAIQDARQVCADLDAKLPLPKSEAEFEDLRAKYSSNNVALDATDLDQDGTWEDSSGNVVEYLAELWTGSSSTPRPYLMTGTGSGLSPRPDTEFVYKAYYGWARARVYCFKKPKPVPTTPPCVAPASFNELFESFNSVVDDFDNEVSNWSPEPKLAAQYQNRGIRAQKWLGGILNSTKRYFFRLFPTIIKF